ncbi:MAG: class I SAM-dependent methyltransferase [Bacilli bacterium]|jgi:2-polyprenyl-3-methyl-5-hydroxy-6-metoxy-1,4-benzoquinol methylase
MNKKTKDFYDENAKTYISTSFNLNVSSSRDRFLSHLKPKSLILDAGFGSGRDSLYFQEKGYQVDSLDCVKEFLLHGKEIGLKHVIDGKIEDLNEVNKYDAIYCSASLLHFKKEELKSIFLKLAQALKDHGILFVSFKEGNFEGYRDNRYYTDLTKESLLELIQGTGLEDIDIWIDDDSMGRSNKWLNVILQK